MWRGGTSHLELLVLGTSIPLPLSPSFLHLQRYQEIWLLGPAYLPGLTGSNYRPSERPCFYTKVLILFIGFHLVSPSFPVSSPACSPPCQLQTQLSRKQ